jgi:adenylate cyclase
MDVDHHLSGALRQARLENAMFLNRMRAVGVAGFTILSAWMAYRVGENSWEHAMGWLAAYLGCALVLMIGGQANGGILSISRFAVPVLDVPMVLGIQYVNLAAWTDPASVAAFSVGIYVCLLLLSALTLHSTQIFISLAAVILAQRILQVEAGTQSGGQIASILVFLFATGICVYAGRSRLRLLTRVVEEAAGRRRLQRYFSPGVGELLEKQGGGELGQGQEYEVTVIFTDIRGFTALTEQMRSQEVVSLLNAYHARMVEALFKHGGTLDKYIGDGLMAYFNAPVGQVDHAERAFRCAMAMRQELAALNTERSRSGDEELRMGIGMHTGRAIVGDIGAPNRREFTAIGDAVNVAARIEEMTKNAGSGVLISESTAVLLPDSMPLTEVGEFTLRGSSQPLRLYAPGSPGAREKVSSDLSDSS